MKYLMVIFLLSACSLPYRSAFVRSYTLHGYNFLSQEELVQRLRSNPEYYIIVDTREAKDFNQAHIPGAISYPSKTIKNKDFDQGPLGSVVMDRPLLVYNVKGRQYGSAQRVLELYTDQPVLFLEFGFSQWTGPMAGSDTESALEKNRKIKNDYRL